MKLNQKYGSVLFLYVIILILLTGCGQFRDDQRSGNEVAAVDTPEAPPTETEAQNEQGESETESNDPNINKTTSGTITENEVWRGEIHLTGDIDLANGVTLIIEPGTIVFMASNSDDTNRNDTNGCFDEITCTYDDPTLRRGYGASTILIDGRNGVLISEGTADQPIIFRPEGNNDSAGQFGGIYIEQGSLKYSKIINGSGMQVLGSPGAVEVAFNEIRGCVITCVGIHKEEAWVHHNILDGGGHQTLGIQADNALIEHNIILHGNLGIGAEGIDVVGARNVTIRNNLVVDCGNGIALHGENVQAINNTIVHIEGPPEWNYYQGEVVYPIKNSWLGDRGFIIGGNETTVKVINNIVAGDFTDGIMVPQQLGPGSLIDHNLFWEVDYALNDPSLEAVGDQNFFADPLFIDLAAGELHLLPESPAVDSGWTEITDSDGSPSDLGAYGGPDGNLWE